MSLPALKWKMLPEYNFPYVISKSGNLGSLAVSATNINVLNGIYSSFTSSIYHDGTPRITGSISGSTGWTFFISGSPILTNTNVVYGYPPTITAASQSVIFVGSSVVPSNSGSIRILNRQYGGTRGTFNIGFYAGVSTNSSTYKNYTFTPPMETGSAILGNSSSFMGYATLATGGSMSPLSSMRIYESNECLLFLFINTSGNTVNALFMGAIIDPETTNYGEVDGRVYGISSTETVSYPGGFMARNWNCSSGNSEVSSTTGARFLTSNLADTCKTAYYIPNTKVPGSSSLVVQVSDTAMSSSFSTDSENLPKLPIFVKDYYTGRFVGRYREVQYIKNTVSGMTFNNNTTITGYAIGASTFSSSNCVFLPRI
jgi:hypothetical protein